MSIEVHTFGCRLNSYESELIKQAANEAGLKDTIIFNGCAVTAEAERQLRQAIRRAKRNNPDCQIIVTGCAAQVNPGEYASMPEVTQVIGNTEKTEVATYRAAAKNDLLPQTNAKIMVNDIMSVKETASHMVESFEGKARAFLEVQNGCNHRCTYCIIPYGRGNSRSVPLGEIVEQAKKLVDLGYNELVLTGVDITSYGADLPGSPSFGATIGRLLQQVPQLPRLRISSIDVAEIDEHLLELLIHEPRLMPYLHLSLQSGDDLILKRMKRRHNRAQVIEFCTNLREARPGIAFGADIIAGFPTETDEMFARSLAIVEEAGLSYLHVFPYSARKGTPAARMPQVPMPIRKARAAILREAGKRQLSMHYAMQVGRKVSVVIEDGGMARAEDFSLVCLSKPDNAPALRPGSLLEVKINAANGADYLVGAAA